MTLAALNLLAFAWHTVLELLEPPWLAAREAAVKRIRFLAQILTLSASFRSGRLSSTPSPPSQSRRTS
jgi:hypothetical protein